MEVLGQLDGDGVREWDRSGPPALGLVDGDSTAEQLDLLLDVDPAAEEVDVAHTQGERLALSESAAGGDDGDGAVAARQGVDGGFHLSAGPGLDLLRVALGSRTDLAWPGFVAIRPSSTAAREPDDTLVKIRSPAFGPPFWAVGSRPRS